MSTFAAPPRYPIEALLELAPPAPARVGGRVVREQHDASGSTLWVREATGELTLSAPPRLGLEAAPWLGAWVVARGTWTGRDLLVDSISRENASRVAFPRPGGDWEHLQRGRLERLRARARALAALRRFFDERAFLEVETPQAVPSPGLDLHLDAYPVAGEEPPRWLHTSPEYQMKRLLAGGLGRIYQVARCFRRGELGPLHEPEFTMIEWYRAFTGAAELMGETAELVAHVARAIRGEAVAPAPPSAPREALQGARTEPVDLSAPWPSLTVEEAFARYAGETLEDVLGDLRATPSPEAEERFYRLFVERVEPRLGHGRPVFLTHWPASMASLARIHPDDPRFADRFEAYVAGIELCNGFGELIDPGEQRARLLADQSARAAAGLPVYPIDEAFVGALEEGLPPCAGNALGFDRLLMLVLGTHDIQSVIAFPRTA